jgi:hypothetical protein
MPKITATNVGLCGVEGLEERIIIGEVTPIIDLAVRGLCTQPYPGHPRGCPNWNKAGRFTCPPKAPPLAKVLDLTQPVYAVAAAFNLAEHVARMAERHPGWSERQKRNCLYWQGTVRKRLRAGITMLLAKHPELIVLECPEACGLLVGATVAPLGVELEWMPEQWDWHVALAGHPQPDLEEQYPDFAAAIRR